MKHPPFASLFFIIFVLMEAATLAPVVGAGAVPDAHPSVDVDRLQLTAPSEPFPAEAWPIRPFLPTMDEAGFLTKVEETFAPTAIDELSGTDALLILHRGALVYQRYADGFGPHSRFPLETLSAQITNIALGILVDSGRIKLPQPVVLPEVEDAEIATAPMRVSDLMHMSSGIEWAAEEAGRPATSDNWQIYYGSGHADMAAFAASKPRGARPVSASAFRAADAILLADLMTRLLVSNSENPQTRRQALKLFFGTRLFAPVGIQSAVMEFDKAGTFIGSVGLYMTADDLARVAYLIARDGEWAGKRIISEAWVQQLKATNLTEASASLPPHFWHQLGQADGSIVYSANGQGGQFLYIDEEKSLIIIRLGRSPNMQRRFYETYLGELATFFPQNGSSVF